MEYTLRKWELEDLNSLVKYANNKKIAANLRDGFPHPYGMKDGIRFIEMARSHDPQQIFAIDIDGKACGAIGIHPKDDIYRKNAELGYWLAEKYWGNGIISRVIPGVVQYAFEYFKIDRIFATPFGENKASQRVLEKSGFVLEARLSKSIYKWGQYQDELIYAIRK